MIAGLPGTGIGGLFYILASAWMALREGWSKLNKRHDLSRSKFVKRQILLTMLIVAGMWATGELVGRLLLLLSQRTGLLHRLLDPHAHNLWKMSIFFWAVATLVSLYLLMQTIRLVLRLSGYLSARPPAIDAPERATLQGRIVLEPAPGVESDEQNNLAKSA